MPITDDHFDPNKSFFSLKIVKSTIWILFVISLTSFFIILINTELSLDWSSKGFNTVLSVYRFPLGILALSIPIIAIYATNHRSLQQKEQIALANSQNYFTNYFKHLEEFEKYYLKIVPPDMAPLVQRPGINASHYHKLLYRDARLGNYEVNESVYEKQYQSLIKIIDGLCKVDAVESSREKFNSYIRAVLEIRNFCGTLYLWYQGGVTRQDIALPNSNSPIIEAFTALQVATDLFLKICDFSFNPRYSRYIPMITLLDPQLLKDAYLGKNELIGVLGFKAALEGLDGSYLYTEDSKTVSDYKKEFNYFNPAPKTKL